MWGPILRFIGSNLAGLGVGYAASDLFRTVSPASESKSIFEIIADKVGLSRTTVAILTAVILAYLAYSLGWIKKGKR